MNPNSSLTRKSDTFMFMWHVDNFRMCPLKRGEYLDSPTFRAVPLQDTNWRLRLYPRGEDTSDGRFPSAYLFREGNPEAVTACYSMSILTDFDDDPENGVTRTVSVSDGTRFRKDEGTARNDFQGMSNMFEGEDGFLVRGSLVVRCVLCGAMATRDTGVSSPGSGSAVLRRETDFPTMTTSSCFSSTSSRRLFGEYGWSQWSAARTTIPWQKRIVNWSVDDFWAWENGRTIRHSMPARSFPDDIQLSLTLQKTGATEEAIQLRFGVQANQDLFRDVFTHLELLVHDGEGQVFTVYEDNHFFEMPEEVWSFPLAIETRSNNGVRDSVLTRNGQLLLRFVVSISSKKADRFQTRRTDLKEDMRRLYENSKFCDVTLRCPDRTFLAHKSVLCGRSDVFSAMFENDTREKETGLVEIDDLGSDTLSRMLDFMYSDELSNLAQDEAIDLFSAADKYQVLALKDLCSSVLVAGLSVSNVCGVLQLAELHQDASLKNSVADFICSNAKEVLSASSWGKFMDTNSKLAGEIMHNVLVKKL